MIKTLKYINKEDNKELVFNNYSIDEKGNICNNVRQIPRKWLFNKKGYAYVQLRDENGNMHKIFIARAILSTFHSEQHFKGANACFKDENINNFDINNLVWLSDIELARKGTRLERIKQTKIKNNSYEKQVQTAIKNNSYAKIVEKNRKNNQLQSLLEANKKRQKKVNMLDKNHCIIKTFSKLKDVKEDGFDPSNVSKCCRNKCKMYKGFYFEFA